MVYEACPYCLTEIATEKAVRPIKREPVAVEEDAAKVEIETPQGREISVQQPSVEASNCKHYFGYLSERPSGGKPPEECMVCPNIVQCMLKGVTG